jgi:ketosteroid isomerase-like protein
MVQSNVELARRGYEAALRGDLDTIREFLHPDVRWHGGNPEATGACRNRDQALEFMRRARGRRGVGELVDIVDAGEKVVVIIRPPSSGDEPSALSANVTTFRDGKVVEMVHYTNPEDAFVAAESDLTAQVITHGVRRGPRYIFRTAATGKGSVSWRIFCSRSNARSPRGSPN